MYAGRTQGEVDERQTLGQRLLLKLGDATHYPEEKTLLFFQAPEPAHETVEFLLGFLADTARIDDHDTGLLYGACRLETGRLEQVIHLLHVVLVHLASKVFDVVPQLTSHYPPENMSLNAVMVT